MMGPADTGGVTREAPRADPAPLSPRPSPAWASATTDPRYSRFVHQLPHLPHVQHRAPSGLSRHLPFLFPTDPRTLPRRDRSRPGSPPPQTPPVSALSCHSRGAASDTSRRGDRGSAWSGSARLSSRCARGTLGLVVLSARQAGQLS